MALTTSTMLQTEPAPTRVFAEINMQEIVSSQNELTQNLIQTNFNYLSLAVGVIIGLSIVFYFFNLKPLNDDIKKQRQSIRESKDKLKELEDKLKSTFDALEIAKVNITAGIKKTENELSEKISTGIKGAEARVDNLSKKIDSELVELKAGTQVQRVLNEWQMHYVWDAKNVPVNVLTSLLDCASESYKFIKDFKKAGPFFEDMALEKFKEYFKKNKKGLADDVGYLKDKIKTATNIPEKNRNELEQIINT